MTSIIGLEWAVLGSVLGIYLVLVIYRMKLEKLPFGKAIKEVWKDFW